MDYYQPRKTLQQHFETMRTMLERETKDHYYKPRQNPKQKIGAYFQVPPRKQVLPSEQLTQKQQTISLFLTYCN